MRAFMFLFFSVAAYAAPQAGYNYQFEHDSLLKHEFTQNQQQQLQQPQQQTPQTRIETFQTAYAEAPKYPQPQQVQQPAQFRNEAPQMETVAAPLPQSQPQEQRFEARHQTLVPQYNKEFYYLSAPEEDFEQSNNLDDQLGNIRKKNIRVIFIRAPENNQLADAALQLATQSLNQKTSVYVFTKQHDAADLANKFHQVRTGSSSKPEVTFVKYHTPQEAEHAHRTIQAQYEALDGPNHFNQEVVGSTHHFTGRYHTDGAYIDLPEQSSKSAKAVGATPNVKYLPSNAKL